VSAAARVLVTGATGFLGSALARALASEGADVHAFARGSSDRSALDGVLVTWHPGDVTDPASLRAAVDGAEVIVHAAGRLGEAGVPEATYRAVNVEGRGTCSPRRSPRAPASACCTQQPGRARPDSGGAAVEDAPYAPATPYEQSKADAERIAVEHAGRGLDVVIARPGFIYGPGDHHVLGLFQAIQKRRFFLIDGGSARCQPTFVDDAVAGMLACLRRGRPGRPYHIAVPRAVTFRELAEEIAGALRVSPPRLSLPRPAAMLGATVLEEAGKAIGWRPPLSRAGVAFFSEDRVFSCERARAELGWTRARSPVRGCEDGRLVP
jgi:dihydroflavonol-4-reductase